MRKSLGIMVMAATMAATGCLRKDTSHNIYLAPDGRLSWLAVEANVRSDESDAAKRLSEEQAYLQSARTGDHGVGRALTALDPVQLNTRIVRDQRPFLVVTEAEFGSVEDAVRRLLGELQVNGDVTLRRNGSVTSLVVRVDAIAAAAGDAPASSDLDALAEDLNRYRIVLTEGRFVAARGFDLRDGDTVAVPVVTPWEKIVENGGILEMSLSWTR